MNKNFVTDIIESFNEEEIESFRQFLASPYFNKGNNSIFSALLFDVLLDVCQKKKISELEKSTLFEKIFPGKPIVESKIDKLMSELKAQLQTFLVTEAHLSEENEIKRALELTVEMRKRKLENRFVQSLESVKKLVQENLKESVPSEYYNFQIAFEEHNWQSVYNKARGDLNLHNAIYQLEAYYEIQKTEFLNRLLLQQRMSKLPNTVEKIFDSNWNPTQAPAKRSVIFEITWQIHLLLKEPSPGVEGFFRLLKLLRAHEQEIHPESLAELYAYLRGFCVSLINDKQFNFFEVLHEIHKDNLERGYLFYENQISPSAFMNITQVALSVQDITWAKQFINQYKGFVAGENETLDFFRMNLALCLFAEKKYEEAMDNIPFGSSYSAYHLMAKRLELKIYYEMRSELLEFKIDAFKMFISRAGKNVLSPRLYETFVNFINILRQLNQSNGIKDNNRARQLEKRIKEKELIAEESWLLEKARELGHRKK